MRWEPLAEASELLGFADTPQALRSRGTRGSWLRDRDGTGPWLYAVPESLGELEALIVDGYPDMDRYLSKGRLVVSETEDIVDDDEEGAEPEGGPYYYDEARDVYVFSLKSKPRHPFPVDGEDVRRIVDAYSNDSDGATQNQIARMMGWHRRTVKEVLRALGKTKDSLPFTDEYLSDADEGEAVEDLIRKKEEKIHLEAQRKNWKAIEDLAKRAKQWKKFINNTMSEVKVEPAQLRNPVIKRPDVDTLITHATDLHYGKHGWRLQAGKEYNREICRERLLTSTERMLNLSGRPRHLIFGQGADWFHIDNQQMGTTRGTPQDCDGRFMQIFTEGCQLAIDQIELGREVATEKTSVIIVPGNHDYYTSQMLGHYLTAYYRDVDDVEVSAYLQDRHYLEIGCTLVGLAHGDKTHGRHLGQLMATEAKEAWARTRRRLWLLGHLHSKMAKEDFGVEVEHMQSLAGTDAWHKAKGYVGNSKALNGYLFDTEGEMFSRLTVRTDT